MANPPIKTSANAKEQAGKISIHKRKNDEKRPITDESEETEETGELMPLTAEDPIKKGQNNKEKEPNDKGGKKKKRGKPEGEKTPETATNSEKTATTTTETPSDGLPPRAVQTAMEAEMEAMNKLLGVSAEENQRLRPDKDLAESSQPAATSEKENTKNETAPTTTGKTPTVSAAETASDTANNKSSTSAPRLDVSGLTAASAAIPEKDPLTEIKKQAIEHGRAYARPYGSYKSFPSPDNTGSEAVKAHLAGEKAAAATKAQAATSTPQVNSDGTIAQASSSDPLELFLRKNENTAKEASPALEDVKKDEAGNITSKSIATITKEEAAKFYPAQFTQGYGRGFNEGYGEGLQAKQLAAKQEADARKERLKTTPAYIESARIGRGLSTSSDSAAIEQLKKDKEKAIADYSQPYLAIRQQVPAPSNLAELKDNYDAYTMGFNDEYGKGLVDAQNAKKASAEQNKTLPTYQAGEAIAQQEAAKSIPKAAAKEQLQSAKAGKTPEEQQLIQRGYEEGFSKAYTASLVAAQETQRQSQSDEGIKSGAFGAFYEAGIKGDKEQLKTLLAQKLEAATPKMSQAEEEEFGKKAQNYYNIGYNKALKEKHEAAAASPKAEAQKLGSALFRQGKMIGKLIGAIKAQYGDVNKFLEGKPKLMAILAQPLPTPEEKTSTDAKLGEDATTAPAQTAAKKTIPLSPATTLDKLKAYLFSKSNVIDVPKKSDEEIKNMDPVPLREYELAIALAENRGEEADKERGYSIGYNEGYALGLQAKQKQKAKETGESSPEFEAAYKQGLEVGKVAGEVQQKEAATPEQKAEFRQKLNAIHAQAREKGDMFYQAYLKGFNRAYAYTIAGEEVATGLIEIGDEELKKIIAKYEAAGDTQMVDRLTELYEKTYEEIHKRDGGSIYERLTKPFEKAEKGDSEKGGSKFVGFPTERELQEEKTNAVKGQVGADGELSKPFKKELEDTKKKLEFAKATKSADEAKLTQLVDTINGEIAHMEVAYVAAYDHASKDAKEEGYSFVAGYEARIKALYAEAGTKPEMDTPSAVPAGGKYENKAEIKKGAKAAEAFANSVRVNALLSAGSKEKDASGKVVTKKYKADKSLAMPPVVVSNDFKAGYEEGEFKWKVIKLMKDGIPVPTKLKSDDLFKEMSGGDKEPKPLSTIVRPSAEAVAETKKDDAAGTGEIKEPKPIKRTALLPTNSAEANGKIAADAAAEKARKKESGKTEAQKAEDAAKEKPAPTDDQTLDIEYYKRKILLAQVESLQGELSSRKKAAKSNYLENLEKAKGELLNAFPKKDEKTEAPLDENKKQTIRQEFDKALTAFETAAKSSSAPKEDKNRYDAYTKALKNDPTLKKPTALSTREEVERYVKMFDATIVNFKDNNYEAQTYEELSEDKGSLNNVLTKIALAKIGVSRKDATPEQIAEAKAAASTQAAAVLALVTKSAEVFEGGYTQGKNASLKAVLEVDEEDESSVGSMIAAHAKEIGYAQGFVQKVAELGNAESKQLKAMRLVKKFIAGTEFNLPPKVTEAINDLKEEEAATAMLPLADTKKQYVEPSAEIKALVDEEKGDIEMSTLYYEAHDKAIQSGSRDGLAAYNLSTDTFSFAATGANKQRKDGEMLRFAGPLGEEVHRIFEEIIKSVQSVQIPKGMKDEVEKVNTALKSATTAEKLLEDAAIKAFFNRILNSPPKNGSTVDANQNPVADTQTEAQKADPKPLLPKDATEEQKTAHTQALAEWQKREDERALDLRRVLGKQNAIVDLSKGKESLTLPSTKNLNYSEGTLDLILAAGTKFQFEKGFLNIADNTKQPKENELETTVFNSNKTFALMGAGVKISKTDALNELTNVKVIIPSLQKGLIVEGARVSLLEVDAEKYIKLPSGSTSLKLAPEGLKKELYAMHNNLMSFINDKEISNAEGTKQSNTNTSQTTPKSK